MHISKLAKDLLSYLPVLAVLAATVTGLFLGKNLYPGSLPSQPTVLAYVPAEPGDPGPLPIQDAGGPCFSSLIFTSWPPKCKTFEGKFIPLPGASNVFLIPERK
jgi:hypothetical protein